MQICAAELTLKNAFFFGISRTRRHLAHVTPPPPRGADLAALVREAGQAALKDYTDIHLLLGLSRDTSADTTTNQPGEATKSCGTPLKSREDSPHSGEVEWVIKMRHFLVAVRRIRPSVSEKV